MKYYRLCLVKEMLGPYEFKLIWGDQIITVQDVGAPGKNCLDNEEIARYQAYKKELALKRARQLAEPCPEEDFHED